MKKVKKKTNMSAKGFTLVELMVTIVIVAILVTVGLPSLQKTVRNNRITTQGNELITTLNMARMESIRRSSNVTVCSSADGTSCAGANDWAIGWIFFQDIDGDGIIDDTVAGACDANIAAGNIEDCLIRSRNALPPNTTFTATNGAGAFSHRITFSATGMVNDPATGNNPTTAALDPIALTLRSTGCGVREERRIAVNNLGRSRIDVRDCP